MFTSEFSSIASRKLKFRLIFSIVIAGLAQLLNWLILGDTSPFHRYFVWHGDLPNAWGMTMLPAFLLSALISGNPHSPPTVLLVLASIIQWIVIGFLLSIPVSNLWIRPQRR